MGQGYTESDSLTLRDAIQQAQASPRARAAQDRVDAAQGVVTQAGLRPNPRLYLQSEDLRPWAGNFDFPNATEEYGYVGQNFELGSKRARRLEVAHATVEQAEAERTLVQQQVAGQVAAAYWNAVVSTKVVQLLEQDSRAVDSVVEYNKARVDAGATRGVDLIRVQIERDRLLLVLAGARREVTLNRIELFRLMGSPADRDVNLTDSLTVTAPLPMLDFAAVLNARPDVAVAREAVALAEADARLQRANGVPDLDLLGGYKRNAGENTLYTSLQIPLPFRNRNQGEVARADANVHLAKDQLLQLELTVRAEVSASHAAYTQQEKVVHDLVPDMLAHARQNLSIMDDAYRTGGVDLLRYLDAERTAFDVEVSALRTLAEFQQATLRLQLAYGGTP